ncbi:sigma-w pathway protein ysdB [Sporosarcina psychrophila]|uniref:sigma-w pathway protein ysdB n=1 Tax=Sporosarcina psychrophila TaxID=1476 RepID=UPI00078CB66B|nr:sigma-w pathway protein ysdB [Sporosarcina psychrophila]AMQ05832.1 sigma-w pathway protein ysdB [Sporosarcina psychrophila]
MGLLIRLIIIGFIIYLVYRGIRYLTDPKRKLDDAYAEDKYYFYDEVNNVRKNFFLSYKGAMFEGEKYLDTTDDSIDVISIFVWVKDETKLQDFTKADFDFLSSTILSNYPKAAISWKNPIERLMEQ